MLGVDRGKAEAGYVQQWFCQNPIFCFMPNIPHTLYLNLHQPKHRQWVQVGPFDTMWVWRWISKRHFNWPLSPAAARRICEACTGTIVPGRKHFVRVGCGNGWWVQDAVCAHGHLRRATFLHIMAGSALVSFMYQFCKKKEQHIYAWATHSQVNKMKAKDNTTCPDFWSARHVLNA